MKLFTSLATSIIALTISTAVFAETKTPHSVGIQLGGGNMEYKGEEGEAYGTSYLFYNYKFAPFYSVEVGLLGGTDADWDCKKRSGEWECYSDDDRHDLFDLAADDLELNAVVVALKTDLSLSKRNKLYAKAGLSYYNYEIELNKEKIADEDGVGFMLEAGWEYRWDMGIGMNAGLQYHKMNDLKSSTLNVGISYAF
ncbi:outer membrane beta-barrel protein [Colwellia sp. RE-S-Sl-9]